MPSKYVVRFTLMLLATATTQPSFAETIPALPIIPDISCTSETSSDSNKTISVPTGGNFQQALDDALPGDTITLQAGATFTGTFVAPAKSGRGCITIRSSAPDSSLPAIGTRTSPSYASLMPKLVSPGGSALTFPPDSHHYRVMHVEIASGTFVNDLVSVGTLVSPSESNRLPHHIEFDRVYIHGHPTLGTKRGIALNAKAVTIKNSYISDFKMNGADTQAICGWAGGGQFRIINNYLEAAAENVMFGGAQPWFVAPDGIPTDIEIGANYMFKPLSWNSADPSYVGSSWTVKNLFELKNAKRVLVHGNVFQNNWPMAQGGFAILFTPKNDQELAPWSTVEDVTFQNNIIKNSTNGISITAFGWPYQTQRASRILIRNNLFLNMGGYAIAPDRFFQIVAGPADVIIRNNTAFHNPDGALIMAEGTGGSGFIFENNIFNAGALGMTGSGTGIGIGSTMLNALFPGFVVQKNIIVGIPASLQSQYPSNNFYPGTAGEIGFVGLSNADYRLSSSSPYKNGGTDGRDPGVNFDKLPSFQSMEPIADTTSPAVPTNLRVF